MKKPLALLAVVGIFCLGAGISYAAETGQVGGPKGGKLLENTEPRAEFYVEKDHAVTITFYDVSLKPTVAGDQSARVIAETPDGKKALEFEKRGDVLVSKGQLPEGHGYNLVVQLKQTAAAKPQNFRFKFNSDICGGCNRPEYACICNE